VTIKSWGGRVIPERGIEQACITLMHACSRAKNTVGKSRYQIAAQHIEFDVLCELVYDLGYGSTKSDVQGTVWDVYNEHGHRAWETLAEKLKEMYVL
jgi:hypothetical protein